MVHEGLVLLVPRIGQDDGVEELAVLLVEEEVQFVAGVLGVLFALLRVGQLGPVQDEPELDQRRIAAQRHLQAIDACEAVVGLELRSGDVVEFECLVCRHDGDLFLLGEVGLGIQAGDKEQVAEGGFLLVKRDLAAGGVLRIDGHDVNLLVGAEVLAVDSHNALFVGAEVQQDGRRFAQKVEVGEVPRRGGGLGLA